MSYYSGGRVYETQKDKWFTLQASHMVATDAQEEDGHDVDGLELLRKSPCIWIDCGTGKRNILIRSVVE